MKLLSNKGLFWAVGFLMAGTSAIISPAYAQAPPAAAAQEVPADQLVPPAETANAPGMASPSPAAVQDVPVYPSEELPPEAPVAIAPTAAPVVVNANAASAAELAIVNNDAALDSLNPPPVEDMIESGGEGPSVAEILKQKGKPQPPEARYLVIRKDHHENDFDSRLTTARTALSRGRPAAALELFNTLYESNPNDKRVLMGRAVALQQVGQHAEAVAAYEAVLNNDPKNIEALTNMLGIFRNQDKASAIEKLKQLQTVYPYNADVAAQLGMVYGDTGDYLNALKYLELADALKPGNGGILFNKAVVYDRMGKTQKASELYRQILSLADEGHVTQGVPVDVVKKRLQTIR